MTDKKAASHNCRTCAGPCHCSAVERGEKCQMCEECWADDPDDYFNQRWYDNSSEAAP